MYDGGKIIPGLVIFALFLTFPFWVNMGKAAPAPKPKLPKTEKRCVESKEFMRAEHMKLLNQWRDWALRDGKRVYVGYWGRKFNISLQNTCIKQCHTEKKEFCDQCHNYVAVKPYCWDCHYVPEETKKWASPEEASLK